MFNKLQPAVKKETLRVTKMTVVGILLMWVVFAVLHLAFPNGLPLGPLKSVFPDPVPFNYTVILGGLCGGFIAVLNFFLMGLTVQKIAVLDDEKRARTQMTTSYSRRMLIQMVWVILAIYLSFIQPVAGIIPLLFPSIGIKIMGILNK